APYYLSKVQEYVLAKPHHVIAPGSSRNSEEESYGSNDMAHNHYLEEARKKTQERNRNSKPSVMPYVILQNTANGSTPNPKRTNQTSRSLPTSKSSCVTITVVPKADHSRNSSSFSDSKHFFCSTCHKCVFNANHDACITKLLNEMNSRKVKPHKTKNNNNHVEQKSHTQKPGRQIFLGHTFSPKKTSVVYEKTSPRSCLRWKPMGKIFTNVGLKWIPIGKLFDSCTSKVDSEPPNGSNDDITNPYKCEETLNGFKEFKSDEHEQWRLLTTLQAPLLKEKKGVRFSELGSGDVIVDMKNVVELDACHVPTNIHYWTKWEKCANNSFKMIFQSWSKQKKSITKLIFEGVESVDKRGSSEGSGITPEVPDEPKDNSAVVAEKQAGYVQTNLTLSSAELEIQSMVDVPIHQEDLAVQRTPLIDPVISMVTEKTASTPTPPTTQAHGRECDLNIKSDKNVIKLKQLLSSPMCQTISNIDAHVEGEQFHESKQLRSKDLKFSSPPYKNGMVRTSEGYKSTHKKMEILQEPPSNNALVETARRSLRNPVMEIRRSPKPNHRNPDGSSYWKKRHVKFDTPCSHFQILIKDIIIAEIPTTQLS
ncbi:hypothetical protein Tco_0434431, partial [Tanacetum coccineum]